MTLASVWPTEMAVAVRNSPDNGFVPLFNGKDLTGFGTWLQNLGKNNDPQRVFSVQDGMIRISGEVWGGLITGQEYENYHLVAEFKWGEKTWPPREYNARDSGILLHCTGKMGAVRGLWMASIECNLMEGRTGDFIIFSGKHPAQLIVEAHERPDVWVYQPGASPREFVIPPGADDPRQWGRVGWYARDPLWKDVKGFRGNQDLERPIGEWNRVDCICDGDKITIMVNGKVANIGTKANPCKGRIMLQSEAAEIFFRNIELKLLKP